MSRSKGVKLQEIANELVEKAYGVGEELGGRMVGLVTEEVEFLARFEHSLGGGVGGARKASECVEEKREVQQQPQSDNEAAKMAQNTEGISENKFPLKPVRSPFQEKFTPVSSPLRNDFFLDSPIIKSREPDFNCNDSD